MSSLVFALVRHGHYEQPDGVPSAHLLHPLTDRGREQAAASVELIRMHARELGLGIHRQVFASPLLRAWQSAHIVAEGLSAVGRVEVVERPELAERGLGAAANLSVAEIERLMGLDPRVPPLPEGWKANSHFRLPVLGAESMVEAGARVARFLEMAALRIGGKGVPDPLRDTAPDPGTGSGRLVVVFGHGGAFRHAAVTLGLLEASDVPGLSMYHCRPVLCAPTLPGRWRHVAGEWKVWRQEAAD